jgi:glycyl-tRNA synthetase
MRIRIDQYLSMKDMEQFHIRMKEIAEASGSEDDESHAKIINKEIGDTLNEKIACPSCGKKTWTEARSFNLMMGTYVGTARDEENLAYLRPETAQGMFVDFTQIVDAMRPTIPFGIGQIGKAFRNEITPGNFIFRTREFEQMEIEYFVRPEDAPKAFVMWLTEMQRWCTDIGLDETKLHEFEVPDDERAHYSARTVDIEFDYPFGRKELYGLANRTDFDLTNHAKHSGKKMTYRDPKTNDVFTPYVIEPTWGVNRTMLAILASAYKEAGDRKFLALKPAIAPYKAAVFPLLSNKEELVVKAKEIYHALKKEMPIAWDDRGNIGKRYYAQDEIGTPYCITIDFDTLTDHAVTVRDRDSATQERMKIEDLKAFLISKLAF